MKLTPKKFLLLAVVIVIVAIIGTNWKQIQEMLSKMAGKAAAATPATVGGGSAGSAISGAMGSGTASNNAATSSGAIDYNRVLKNGSKGTEVLMLQQWLNKINDVAKKVKTRLVEDGAFGSKTAAMLAAYGGGSSITLNQAIASYRTQIGL